MKKNILIIEGKEYWENQVWVSDNDIKFKITIVNM